MRKSIYLVCLIIFLSACGGGGSSSGGGASNGVPGPTKYAGTYKGKLTETLSFQGESASETSNLTMKIGNDGRVTMGTDTNGNGQVCIGPGGPVYINGSVIPFNLSGTCFIPDVGNCNFDLRGSIQMSGNSGIGETKGTIKCGVNTINAVASLGVTKT